MAVAVKSRAFLGLGVGEWLGSHSADLPRPFSREANGAADASST
jgi:hypothetical protein